MTSDDASDRQDQQMVLPVAASRPATPPVSDVVDPVASVLVDTGLAHLDRAFEYAVPAEFAESARPGVRVKVRFAGQDIDGFVLDRAATAEHVGRLAPLRRVVSPEPVLTPEVLRLCRAVAGHYAGTLGDVVRLAIPPRHAGAEKALSSERTPPEVAASPGERWGAYPAGAALLRRIAEGSSPAASWLCPPGAAQGDPSDPRDWPGTIAELAAAAVSAHRGALIVLPDGADVARVEEALRPLLGRDGYVRLTAEQGAQARYTAWLKVLRGHVRCVIGTRAAAFAPVHDLGLIVCWDDDDDSFDELRAPYPHTREVLRLRALQSGAALVFGGHTRSVPVQAWLERELLQPVDAADRRPLQVRVAGEGVDLERHGPAALAHIPTAAWQAAKTALESGPVLVQVPRRGYLPALSCATCRTPARCAVCHGPLGQPAQGQQPRCRWCATEVTQWRCSHCGDGRIRSGVVGASRTAEELGRAFPGVRVIRSGGDTERPRIGAEPALVVATPGAEPPAERGYAATLLLDAWALLDRPSLDAGAEAFRRWCVAAALTQPAEQGGVVVLCGAPPHATLPPIEALVRWAPDWFARRELAERRELGQPPAAWMAMLTGASTAVQEMAQASRRDEAPELIGPIEGPPARPGGDPVTRALLRSGLEDAARNTEQLHAARAIRSARKQPGSVHVRVDPAPKWL